MKTRSIPGNPVLIAFVALIVLALSLAGCAAGSTPTATTTTTSSSPPTTTTSSQPPTTTSTAAQSVSVDLAAKNIKFDKSTITVPAGAQVSIVFDNQDAGIPHNFALYTDSSAATSIYVGQIVTGPKKITYTFTAPGTPGNYYFRCDVHPTQMTGTFVVQ